MPSSRSCLPNLFIKAMGALRAFILLPLAAALRSTSEGLTTGLEPVGQCLSKYEDSPWAERNGRAVWRCRVSKWKHCTGDCVWWSGEVPAGYCDHLYGKGKWAEEHGREVRRCRDVNYFHDCVGECGWVKSNTSQPPEGFCLSKYEGTYWAEDNGEAVRRCREIKKWEACVGLCSWKSGELIVPAGYCDHLYPKRARKREVRRCRSVTRWHHCVGRCGWYRSS